MNRAIILGLVVLLLAGCVNIPEEEPVITPVISPEPQVVVKETAPNATPAQNVSTPLAPLPEPPKPNKTNTSSMAVMPKATTVNSSLASNQPNPTWTTEPLQASEGETVRVIIQKPKP